MVPLTTMIEFAWAFFVKPKAFCFTMTYVDDAIPDQQAFRFDNDPSILKLIII